MNLVALVLAAGAGKRFAPPGERRDKLAAPFLGEPLLTHAIRAARAAPVSRVIVAAAPRLPFVSCDDAGPPVMVVPVVSTALSATLQAALAAAGEVDGAFVFLGDMPLVPHDVATRLAALLGNRFAAQPRFAGKPGHPVLLSARAFPAVAALRGDAGAGRLLRERDDVAFLDCDYQGVQMDVDRAEDIARLESLREDDR